MKQIHGPYHISLTKNFISTSKQDEVKETTLTLALEIITKVKKNTFNNSFETLDIGSAGMVISKRRGNKMNPLIAGMGGKRKIA